MGVSAVALFKWVAVCARARSCVCTRERGMWLSELDKEAFFSFMPNKTAHVNAAFLSLWCWCHSPRSFLSRREETERGRGSGGADTGVHALSAHCSDPASVGSSRPVCRRIHICAVPPNILFHEHLSVAHQRDDEADGFRPFTALCYCEKKKPKSIPLVFVPPRNHENRRAAPQQCPPWLQLLWPHRWCAHPNAKNTPSQRTHARRCAGSKSPACVQRISQTGCCRAKEYWLEAGPAASDCVTVSAGPRPSAPRLRVLGSINYTLSLPKAFRMFLFSSV